MTYNTYTYTADGLYYQYLQYLQSSACLISLHED